MQVSAKSQWVSGFRQCVIASSFLVIPVCLIISDVRDDLPSGGWYLVPLIKSYYVQRGDLDDTKSRERLGPFQVLTVGPSDRIDERDDSIMPISDGPQFSVDYISNVEKIAVARNALIVGKTQTGYFILDTDSETLRSFGSVQDFNIGATAAGIDDSQLQNPDDLAAKLTNRAIRPWEYHAMNGLFWLTDYTWGDICVYAGFLLSVVAGLMIPRIREWENQWNARIMALCFGVFLGWVVNTVGIDWMSDDANGAMLMGPVLAAVLGIAAMFCGDLLYWIDKAICRIFRVEQLNGTHRGNHTGHA